MHVWISPRGVDMEYGRWKRERDPIPVGRLKIERIVDIGGAQVDSLQKWCQTREEMIGKILLELLHRINGLAASFEQEK